MKWFFAAAIKTAKRRFTIYGLGRDQDIGMSRMAPPLKKEIV
jgi:hypothetical protein